MTEVWKLIEGYENYSVSTYGQVRNDKTKKVLKGTKDESGRLSFGFYKKQRFLIHRLVALAFIENLEDKSEVDHIDNDPSNNRVENLRWATRNENAMNTRVRTDNTSGIKGVRWNKLYQKWEAYINIDKIKNHLGCYNTIEEATLARQTRANLAFGIFTNACESLC